MTEHALSKEAALNPAALSLDAAAALLSRAGGVKITADELAADVNAGAPTNADGTINLVRYAAWLAKQAGGGRPEAGGRSA